MLAAHTSRKQELQWSVLFRWTAPLPCGCVCCQYPVINSTKLGRSPATGINSEEVQKRIQWTRMQRGIGNVGTGQTFNNHNLDTKNKIVLTYRSLTFIINPYSVGTCYRNWRLSNQRQYIWVKWWNTSQQGITGVEVNPRVHASWEGSSSYWLQGVFCM